MGKKKRKSSAPMWVQVVAIALVLGLVVSSIVVIGASTHTSPQPEFRIEEIITEPTPVEDSSQENESNDSDPEASETTDQEELGSQNPEPISDEETTEPTSQENETASEEI